MKIIRVSTTIKNQIPHVLALLAFIISILLVTAWAIRPRNAGDCVRFDMQSLKVNQSGDFMIFQLQAANCGMTTWKTMHHLTMTEGDELFPTSVSVQTTMPGESSLLYLAVPIPDHPGIFTASYQMIGPKGRFGEEFEIKFTLNPSGQIN